MWFPQFCPIMVCFRNSSLKVPSKTAKNCLEMLTVSLRLIVSIKAGVCGDYTTRLRDVFLFAFQDGSLRSCAGRKRRQVQRHDETASRSVCCSDAAAVTPDRPFRYG